MNSLELQQLFREKHLTLGAAESFTGGLFAGAITSVGGASHFFKGSLVTYATEEKNRILGISYSDIDKYGVVSPEIAGQMASHAQKLLNVDCAISFTGNAGPEAMEGKPVGEIHIGISYRASVRVYSYQLSGTRKEIQSQALKLALNLLGKTVQ